MSMTISSVIAVMVPLFVVVITWALNEHAKLKWEKQQKKEERYRGIVETIIGFYGNGSTVNDSAFELFTSQWRLAWLYCPDEVVLAGNEFLNAVIRMSRAQISLSEVSAEDEETIRTLKHVAELEQQNAFKSLKAFMLTLRREVQGRTKLKGEDYM